MCALVLIPHDQGFAFAAVAGVLTVAGILCPLRPRLGKPNAMGVNPAVGRNPSPFGKGPIHLTGGLLGR